MIEAKKERSKSGLRIISGKELWVWLLAPGTDWWRVHREPVKCLKGFYCQRNHEPGFSKV